MTRRKANFPAHNQKRPRLGQHFLVETEYARIIVESAEIKPSDRLLEIGPGKGALTTALSQASGSLTLVEPDANLARKLKIEFPTAIVTEQNAEDVDYRGLIGPLVVVSNLPYYASVHIYKHLTEQKENISRMVLMFQKEVADRISASPGGRHYGSLSVWSGYNWDIEKVVAVPPSAFNPPPKVESAVLKFTPRKAALDEPDEIKLFRLVRASFVHKRRTIVNNLKTVYTPESIGAALKAVDLAVAARAETISQEQFLIMSQILVGTPPEETE